jgi:Rrf2 family protein
MMADIAKNGDGNPVPLKDVARRQGLSKLYLSQLASPLRNAALLKSVWGNRGGYVLTRPAGEINVREIMEAVDGPVSVIDCVVEPGSCDRNEFCESIGVWRDINGAIIEILQKYTLNDLIEFGESDASLGVACRPAWKRPVRITEKPTGTGSA